MCTEGTEGTEGTEKSKIEALIKGLSRTVDYSNEIAAGTDKVCIRLTGINPSETAGSEPSADYSEGLYEVTEGSLHSINFNLNRIRIALENIE